MTGFAATSLTALQPAGPDPWLQVQLLAQISTQLSSFSINTDFLNSTNPPNPTLVVPTPPSTTPPLQVQINVLWLLSLAISLVASLFAVVVQQWLREYLITGNAAVSIRQRIRLRQLRYQALFDWGVPQIVWILPVLLQLALVLFLSGLCLLINSLNAIVFKAFIAFVGTSLAAYSAFTLLPIIFFRCPYRSQLVDIISRVIFAAIPFIVKAVGGSLFFMATLLWALIPLTVVKIRAPSRPWFKEFAQLYSDTVKSFARRIVARLLASALRFGQGMWWSRERKFIAVKINASSLDINALSWFQAAIPRVGHASVYRRFFEVDLSSKERERFIVHNAAQALGINMVAFNEMIDTMPSPSSLPFLQSIGWEFVEQFLTDLLMALDSQDVFDGKAITVREINGPALLVILRAIFHVHQSMSLTWQLGAGQLYTKRVMAIRSRQSKTQLLVSREWTCLPMRCLYECGVTFKYKFDKGGAFYRSCRL